MKTVVITGSARGLGFEMAKVYRKNGCNVVLSDLSEENLKVAKDKLNLQKGDTVTIVLSKGPMKGNIPNIVGLTLAEAENILKENKLTLGNIKYEYSDTYNNGIVI